MPEDPLLVRVQGVWEELASAPVSFGALGDVDVVASPESRICPPGWAGLVFLGGAAIVTAPSEEAAARIRKAVGELPPDKLTDPEVLGRVLPIGEFLGPAALAYVAADGFRPVAPGGLCVEQKPHGLAELDDLVRAADAKDADEAGRQHALEQNLLPQWRARIPASRRVAAGLGFSELGFQLSVELA
ncbi:hypothetical protein T261_8522 [Streptomyces lydicus]|nr:hypothetical protein T261_8522 [Streptomyces lydicus]